MWPGVNCWRMALRVEQISAVTFRVSNMRNSVRFYRDVLGMELLYGGEGAGFSSLRVQEASAPILNLEQGRSVTGWGRMIFISFLENVIFPSHGRNDDGNKSC